MKIRKGEIWLGGDVDIGFAKKTVISNRYIYFGQNDEKSERNLCFAIDFCAKFLYNEKNMVGGAATWEN